MVAGQRSCVPLSLRLAASAVIAASLCGCGDPRGPRPFPAKGTLRVNGEPAGGATIVLYHVADWKTKKRILPTGTTGPDGTFVLTTYDANDGAPAGDYRVVIGWPAYRGRTRGPDRLKERFVDPAKTELTVHVDARPDNDLVFDIKCDDILPEGKAPSNRSERQEERKEKRE